MLWRGTLTLKKWKCGVGCRQCTHQLWTSAARVQLTPWKFVSSVAKIRTERPKGIAWITSEGHVRKTLSLCTYIVRWAEGMNFCSQYREVVLSLAYSAIPSLGKKTFSLRVSDVEVSKYSLEANKMHIGSEVSTSAFGELKLSIWSFINPQGESTLRGLLTKVSIWGARNYSFRSRIYVYWVQGSRLSGLVCFHKRRLRLCLVLNSVSCYFRLVFWIRRRRLGTVQRLLSCLSDYGI